ncbi:hypothetical protein ACFIOY_27075 [Bradyrhizobium sp. TZ2]
MFASIVISLWWPVLEESIQIEACHYQTSYSDDPTGYKRHQGFWEAWVMRAGKA